MKSKNLLFLTLAVLVGTLSTLFTIGVALAASVDLSVTISDVTNPVTAGDSLQYNIMVTNKGPDQAPNVVMTTTLDTDTSFVSINPSEGCSHSGGVVTCTISLLEKDESETYSLNVYVAPAARGTLLATAEVDSVMSDGIDGNNTHIVETTIDTNVDLKLTHLEPTPNPAVAGGILTYGLVITNAGKSLATGVVLTATLDAKTEEFMGGTPEANCSGDATQVSCFVGDVAPLELAKLGLFPSGSVITIAVRPRSDLTTADTLFNFVTVGAVEAESGAGDNPTFEFSGVVRQSDMTVEMSGPTGEVWSSSLNTYTVTVTNVGPSDNTGVVVTSTYDPDHMVVQEAVGATCDISAGQTVCQLGPMTDTQVVSFNLLARPLAASPMNIILQSEVEGDNVEPAEAVGTNIATVGTQTKPLVIYVPLVIMNGDLAK